jgi:hypothetical protein
MSVSQRCSSRNKTHTHTHTVSGRALLSKKLANRVDGAGRKEELPRQFESYQANCSAAVVMGYGKQQLLQLMATHVPMCAHAFSV